MLKNVVLRGYEVTKSNFEIIGKSESKGTLQYAFWTPTAKEVLETENDNFFSFPAAIELKGFSQEDEDRALFECNTNFVMKFELLKDNHLSEDFINENLWFFENWVNSLANDLLASLLLKTPYRGVSIPTYAGEDFSPDERPRP